MARGMPALPSSASAAAFSRSTGLISISSIPTAGPELIQALIGGSIDIATASGVSAAIGTFAKGAPIRIISSEMTGAPDLYWYVPADSPIHTIQDFNGKTDLVLGGRVLQSCLGSGADRAISSHRETAADRQYRGHHHADHDRPGRCRFRCRAVRARSGRGGKTRIIATGNDVDALRTRAVRVNLTGAQTLQNQHDALVRFMQAYRETIDWMYSSPDALKIYGEYSGLPADIVQRVVKLIPKEAVQTEEVKGLDDVMADAVTQKFLAAPLTPDQVKELVQIPK